MCILQCLLIAVGIYAECLRREFRAVHLRSATGQRHNLTLILKLENIMFQVGKEF